MDARLSGNDASLQAPSVSGDAESAEKMDFLVSDDPLPDEQVSNMIDGERRRVWLASALKHLNEREMKIISARRLAEDGATLEELGADLGISKERASDRKPGDGEASQRARQRRSAYGGLRLT